MKKALRELLRRFRFGRKYHIGLLPTNKKIGEYVMTNGNLLDKEESDFGVYEFEGRVYSAYQRNEKIIRTTYDLDGVVYAQVTVDRRNYG